MNYYVFYMVYARKCIYIILACRLSDYHNMDTAAANNAFNRRVSSAIGLSVVNRCGNETDGIIINPRHDQTL